MPMEMTDELWFGKYKGVTFEKVFSLNPGYLKWALSSGAIRENEMPTEILRELNGTAEEIEDYEQKLSQFWGTETEARSVSRKVRDTDNDPFELWDDD